MILRTVGLRKEGIEQTTAEIDRLSQETAVSEHERLRPGLLFFLPPEGRFPGLPEAADPARRNRAHPEVG